MSRFSRLTGWILHGRFNEIAIRLRSRFRPLYIRFTDPFYLYLILPHVLTRSPEPAGSFLALLKDRVLPPDQLADQVGQFREECDRILNGDFTEFSAVYHTLGQVSDEGINWFDDYCTGNRWPSCFYSEVDYSSDNRPGDIRNMWEIHRHLFFTKLGAGFRLTEDKRYIDWISDQWQDWLQQNRIGFGIGWIAPQIQENAIRNISWILAFSFIHDSSGLSQQERKIMLRSIFQQGCFLNHYFNSRKGISHNHLISEAGGLAVSGMFFSEHAFGKRWLRRGLRSLEKSLLFQIHTDGVQGEFSINYHAFVLETALLVYSLGNSLGIDFKEEFKTALLEMLRHASAMTYPDGSLPQFGDTDNATVFALSSHRLEDRRRYASTGAVLFNDPELKSAAGRFHLETWLLVGKGSYERWKEIPTPAKSVLQHFYPSMNTVCSRFQDAHQQEQLIMRGGGASFPTGIGTSHNHADYLGFTWWVDGQEIFVDPGTYSYSLNDKWRYYFRSAVAHNCLTVDNENMLEVTRQRFGVPDIFPVRTLEQVSQIDYSYLHLEYQKQTGTTEWQHSRRFLHVNPGMLLIRDEVACPGRHTLGVHFQMAGSYKTGRIGGFNTVKSASPWPTLYFATSPDDIILGYGNEQELSGWFSPRYGQRKRLTSAKAKLIFSDTVRFDTLIDVRSAWQLELGDETLKLSMNGVTLAADRAGVRIEKGMESLMDRL